MLPSFLSLQTVGDPIDFLPDEFNKLLPGHYWLAVQRASGSQPRQDLRSKVYNFGDFNVLPGQSVTTGASTITPHVSTPGQSSATTCHVWHMSY